LSVAATHYQRRTPPHRFGLQRRQLSALTGRKFQLRWNTTGAAFASGSPRVGSRDPGALQRRIKSRQRDARPRPEAVVGSLVRRSRDLIRRELFAMIQRAQTNRRVVECGARHLQPTGSRSPAMGRQPTIDGP